jgi:CRP-like cAMP-binding protein
VSCQILVTATTGDVVGEIGVLCYMPQPFTVRSRKLSQLLRLDRAVFMNVVQSFKEDGQRIVDNLLQVGAYITSSIDCGVAYHTC